MLDFLQASPSAFHATANMATRFLDAGFDRLIED